jgi:hypothetical protein
MSSGTGDFNGDRKSDILWQQSSTGCMNICDKRGECDLGSPASQQAGIDGPRRMDRMKTPRLAKHGSGENNQQDAAAIARVSTTAKIRNIGLLRSNRNGPQPND